MEFILTGGRIYSGGSLKPMNLAVSESCISALSPQPLSTDGKTVFSVASATFASAPIASAFILPGLTDVHVHLREPGFLYKETMKTGTAAAARGGYTTVCAMPNLSPCPDTVSHLAEVLAPIRRDAKIHVLPYGTLTLGEAGRVMSQMKGMQPWVFAFSDDGKGVQSEEMMRQVLCEARRIDALVCAHCEDNALVKNGVIHDGAFAKKHGIAGISSESEWRPIERDLALVREIGARYHVCHVSCKESVALIRKAKREGLSVTCETAPHYLLLCQDDLKDDGRFKMNPPLRDKADREALVEGILDGTIDVIATDHAPHAAHEKAQGLRGSLMGIVGLETALPLLYTEFVKTKILTFEKLMEILHDNALKLFGLGSNLEIGAPADLTVFDPECRYTINPADFASMGKSTPFEGRDVYGKIRMTAVGGEIVWKERDFG